jgi:hypothetical protein
MYRLVTHSGQRRENGSPLLGLAMRSRADMEIADLLTFTNANKGREWYGSEEQHFVRAAFCPHSRYSRDTIRGVPTLLLDLDDCLREFFTRGETHPVLSGHLDRFAISRVHTLAGGTPAYLERAEAH